MHFYTQYASLPLCILDTANLLYIDSLAVSFEGWFSFSEINRKLNTMSNLYSERGC